VAQPNDEALAVLSDALGYRFVDAGLLVHAVTHSSFANERPALAPGDNERLEYLGDAVLQWATSVLLWERFPTASAGEMTRRRADLVCEDGLAQLARELQLGGVLRLGRGEERSGGRDKPRLLASALEACVAAVYLDGGNEAAMRLCRALFENRLEQGKPGERDFKTRVQELLQRRAQRPPSYEMLASTGPDHARCFEVALRLEGTELARGEGRSKLEAEQLAAERYLASLTAAVQPRSDEPRSDKPPSDEPPSDEPQPPEP
jgi:ribonuclease-3